MTHTARRQIASCFSELPTTLRQCVRAVQDYQADNTWAVHASRRRSGGELYTRVSREADWWSNTLTYGKWGSEIPAPVSPETQTFILNLLRDQEHPVQP